MLVLSRKVGDSIMIGEDVVVSVLRIGPHSVKLGVVAPNDQAVMRNELLEVDIPLPSAGTENE
jgi:carbon storage regulator